MGEFEFGQWLLIPLTHPIKYDCIVRFAKGAAKIKLLGVLLGTY